MYSSNVKPSSLLKQLPYRALGLAALLGLLPVVAVAAPPQGQWRGTIEQADTDVAVTVRFNAQAAHVHFDEPFSCDVPAQFLKDDGTATVYRFGVSQNGGYFCDGVLGRNVAVTPDADGHLKIVFDTAKATWRGDLRPPAATTP
jgi:hypothetical protein